MSIGIIAVGWESNNFGWFFFRTWRIGTMRIFLLGSISREVQKRLRENALEGWLIDIWSRLKIR